MAEAGLEEDCEADTVTGESRPGFLILGILENSPFHDQYPVKVIL